MRAAEHAFEAMDYSRAGDGVRVLLESLELVAGPPAYRYLRPRPPLLALQAEDAAFSHPQYQPPLTLIVCPVT